MTACRTGANHWYAPSSLDEAGGDAVPGDLFGEVPGEVTGPDQVLEASGQTFLEALRRYADLGISPFVRSDTAIGLPAPHRFVTATLSKAAAAL